MNEKITNFMHDNSTIFCFAIFVGLIMSAFFYGLCCGRQESANNNNVNETIRDIKGAVDTAGSSVADAKKQISNAEASIEKATGAIRDSRDTAIELQTGIDECEKLVDQCLEHNRAAQSILDRIGESSRAGT